MQPVDVGGGASERTVHENLDVGQVARLVETVQGIDDFLCSADGEGGDEQFAEALGAGVAHNQHQLLVGIVERGMQPVTVGRFGDDVVGIRERFRVGEDAFVVAAHVASVAERAGLAALLEGDVDGAAAQHMAGLNELYGDVRGDVKRQVAGYADELRHTLRRVLLGVDGLDGLLVHALFLLVELAGVGLLDAA